MDKLAAFLNRLAVLKLWKMQPLSKATICSYPLLFHLPPYTCLEIVEQFKRLKIIIDIIIDRL